MATTSSSMTPLLDTPTQTTTRERRLDLVDDDDDESSDLGLSITPSDMAGGLSDQQASGLVRALGIDQTPVAHAEVTQETTNQSAVVRYQPRPSSRQRGSRGTDTASTDDLYSRSTTMTAEEIMEMEYAEEERVLTEAAMSSVSDGIWAPFQNFFVGVVMNRIFGPASGTVTRSSLYIGTASAVLGVLGYSQRLGMYSLRSRRNTVRYTNIPYPSSYRLWRTTLWGIGTAGATYLVSRSIRRKWSSDKDKKK